MRPLFPLAFTFCAVPFLAACEGPPGAPGKVAVVAVDDDTFVNETEVTLVDHHLEPLLQIGRNPERHAYLKYELPFGGILMARFQFRAKVVGGAGTLTLYGVAEDEWDGDSLTWAIRPPPLVALGSVNVTSLDASVLSDIDVTTFAVEQLSDPLLPGEVPQATFAVVVSSTSGDLGIVAGADFLAQDASNPDGEGPYLAILPF